MFHLTSWPGGPFSYVLHNRDFQVFHAPRGRATQVASNTSSGPPAISLSWFSFSFSLSLSFLFSYFLSVSPALVLCLSNERLASFAGFLPFFLCFFLYCRFLSRCFSRQTLKVRAGNCRSRLHSPRGRTTVITQEGKFLFNARFLPRVAFITRVLPDRDPSSAWLLFPLFFFHSCFFLRRLTRPINFRRVLHTHAYGYAFTRFRRYLTRGARSHSRVSSNDAVSQLLLCKHVTNAR